MNPDPRLPIQSLPLFSGGRGGEFPELDPELKSSIFKKFEFARNFFPGHLGVKLVGARRGYSKLEVECTPKLFQPAQIMHGGASFGLADTAIGFALMGLYGFDSAFLTIEMKMTFLEPIPAGLVTAEAFILRATKRNAYSEVDVWSQGRLAGRATTSYAIKPLAEMKSKAPAAL